MSLQKLTDIEFKILSGLQEIMAPEYLVNSELKDKYMMIYHLFIQIIQEKYHFSLKDKIISPIEGHILTN